MQQLSIEFNLKEVGCATKSLSVENKNTDSFTHDNKMEMLTILQSRGMENKKSNCWLNSILQCLFASPFHGLIHEVHKSYTGKSILLDGLYSCFQIPPCSDTDDGSDDFTDDAETVHRTRKFVVSTLPSSPSAGCENKEKSRSLSGMFLT